MIHNNKHAIKKIISWKNSIDKMKAFQETINEGTEGGVLVKSYTVKVLKYQLYTREFEMDDEMLAHFYAWLGEYIQHLEKLLENSNSYCIEIADAVRSGEISSEGLKY